MTAEQKLRAVALMAELQTLIVGDSSAPARPSIPPGGMVPAPQPAMSAAGCQKCGGPVAGLIQTFGSHKRTCVTCGWEG